MRALELCMISCIHCTVDSSPLLITGVGTDKVSVREWRKCRITTAVSQAHRISHNSNRRPPASSCCKPPVLAVDRMCLYLCEIREHCDDSPSRRPAIGNCMSSQGLPTSAADRSPHSRPPENLGALERNWVECAAEECPPALFNACAAALAGDRHGADRRC
jgi:hypothetical protein